MLKFIKKLFHFHKFKKYYENDTNYYYIKKSQCPECGVIEVVIKIK
jgi:hypothetical protein